MPKMGKLGHSWSQSQTLSKLVHNFFLIFFCMKLGLNKHKSGSLFFEESFEMGHFLNPRLKFLNFSINLFIFVWNCHMTDTKKWVKVTVLVFWGKLLLCLKSGDGSFLGQCQYLMNFFLSFSIRLFWNCGLWQALKRGKKRQFWVFRKKIMLSSKYGKWNESSV